MLRTFTFIFCVIAFISSSNAQTLAFPGAEGHGRFTTGGRGGSVVRVTNLEDNAVGEPVINGSLRWALQQASPKTIIFDVSGTIQLKQAMKTEKKDDITIAGQTAPGNGICIAGNSFGINSKNIIIRFVRFRPGDIMENGESNGEPDGLGGMDSKDVIIDHCSVSWSVDECLSVYGTENLTVQWCIASEALRVSNHGKGTHCYGGNWGGNKASYHHNLIAHCESRTPRLGPRPSTQENEYVDIRNNVFYNWAGNGCYGGEGMKVNMINNYYKPGPATAQASAIVKYRIAGIGVRTASYVATYPAFAPMKHVWGKYYIDGNKIQGNTEVTNDNWTKGVYAQTTNGSGVDYLWTETTKDTIRLREPLDPGKVTTHTADKAFEKVLAYVGCSLNRDEVDTRIVSDTRNGTASFSVSGNKPGYINSPSNTKPTGAPSDWTPWLPSVQVEIPLDTDRDGIPDEWEKANGLNAYNAGDAKKLNEEGYTYLEVYLNSLVEDIIKAQNEDSIDDPNSIFNPKAKNTISAYTENNTLYLYNLSDCSIQIYSINGKLITTVNVNGDETSIPLSSGIYVVRVISNDKVESLKVIMP